ncbi:MAG: hypothetical protein A2Y57_02295 [Candidatus Woykebacteria bacterium RBG_13_40_7b]|uniref:Peptidyl-tRNA hydrolase n=1 Tax=Candidatus Woykebacteria bacterium RBG_13_40_7b TaxID=1802594 RepID=A0A1G1WCA0_9BACT|nr:MAG: hypothetical protein A2Y57_02295 [Candidatus Woykebacteria bacterium RBG_13_40_7b]
MKLVIGLGNPGSKYVKTRHNLGFMVADKVKEQLTINKGQTILFKPKSFMNLSGVEVAKVMKQKKISLENLLVIHDDVDLEFGQIKLQFGRSSAGHKGVQSVIDELGSQDFWRLRVGVGRSVEEETDDYVLSEFSEEQKQKLSTVLEEASQKVLHWLKSN